MEKTKYKRGQRLQVRIEKLSVGGRGVARHQGLVAFVPDTAPGEDVEIELTMVKKNFAEARLLRVVKASEHRVAPPCPVAGECGGCNWQHVSYDEQLRQKRLLVAESLRKFAQLEIEPREVVPSPTSLRYRNRIQLHHSGPRIGFHRRGSHDIVDVDDCLITEESLAKQIPALKRELAHRKAGRIELSYTKSAVPGFADVAGGIDASEAELAGEFSQVNSAQNRNLVAYVLARLGTIDDVGKRPLYDLFAGSGNFAFPIANAHPGIEIVGVELNRDSVERARRRIAEEGHAATLRFEAADVGAFLRNHTPDPEAVVVLDPPRSGCGEDTITGLLALSARDLIYVSCHPVTLSRDLSALLKAGYVALEVQPFDMFPQTDHVETVVHLRRG